MILFQFLKNLLRKKATFCMNETYTYMLCSLMFTIYNLQIIKKIKYFFKSNFFFFLIIKNNQNFLLLLLTSVQKLSFKNRSDAMVQA